MMHSYLRIEGVAGGCTERGYEGWIECDSVSWSLRGAGGTGALSEIRFVKPQDVASPVLAHLCISAAPVPRARFDFLRTEPGGARMKSYEIVLAEVRVAHVATGPGRESAAMETVVLTFAHANLTSFDQGAAQGQGDRTSPRAGQSCNR